ncbi:hypothetical protein [Planctomycetes bacterium K23_9]|uniref:Uncharacterized protein n=1 Tax=Stieleria marina TaxID=1930275 RepID=A0A517NRT5_9BACT|nr:hypothetical protein K239x_18090 [Planctomycetes bacterium K23_9]
MSKETTNQSASSKKSSSDKAGPSTKSTKSTSSNVDRRQRNGGIAQGGRRKVDRAVVKPFNTSSRIWFGLSLLLTLVIIIWTFSVPFRTEKPIFAWDKSDLPKRPLNISQEILDDPEHRMSDDQYKAFIWEIEADLREQVEIRNRVPDNLPDAEQSKRVAERKIANFEAELESLQELEGKVKDGFEKGSIGFQAMENLREKLAQSGELMPAK